MWKTFKTNIVRRTEYIKREREREKKQCTLYYIYASYLESIYDKKFFNTINEVIIHHEMGCVFDLIFKYVLPNTIHK